MKDRFSILFIIIVLVLSLASCAGNNNITTTNNIDTTTINNTTTNSTINNITTTNSLYSEPVNNTQASDKALLEENGYAVYIIGMMLSTAERTLGANEGSLESVINAVGEENNIYIYYFKTAADAEACYNAKWSDNEDYHLLGIRLINDPTNSLFDYND